MEAQATPGNPREERKDTLVTGKGVQWEKYIPGRGSRGLRQNRTSVAFIPEYPSSGEVSQGCARLEHRVGLGVFLDKALEFCWVQ